MTEQTDPALAQLRELADTMRFALDGAIAAAKLPPDPSGTCALAAVLVRDAVRKFTAFSPTVRGGNGEMLEGALAADGTWQGHYWVEVDTGSASPVILDITADQFGWPAPVCDRLVALPGRYRPGDQEAVEEHMEATLEWIQQP